MATKRKPGRRGEIERGARNLEIIRLYMVEQKTQVEVARLLKVNQATVSRVLSRFDAMNAAQSLDIVQQVKAIQLERLEDDLRAADAAYEAACRPTTETVQEQLMRPDPATGKMVPIPGTMKGRMITRPPNVQDQVKALAQKLQINREISKLRALYSPAGAAGWTPEADPQLPDKQAEAGGPTGGTGEGDAVTVYVGGGW